MLSSSRHCVTANAPCLCEHRYTCYKYHCSTCAYAFCFEGWSWYMQLLPCLSCCCCCCCWSTVTIRTTVVLLLLCYYYHCYAIAHCCCVIKCCYQCYECCLDISQHPANLTLLITVTYPHITILASSHLQLLLLLESVPLFTSLLPLSLSEQLPWGLLQYLLDCCRCPASVSVST